VIATAITEQPAKRHVHVTGRERQRPPFLLNRRVGAGRVDVTLRDNSSIHEAESEQHVVMPAEKSDHVQPARAGIDRRRSSDTADRPDVPAGQGRRYDGIAEVNPLHDGPVNRSSEYTVLFSVATSTWPATISGDAYTSPSTGTSHTFAGWPNAGASGPTPERDASPWYSDQSPEMRGEGEAPELGLGRTGEADPIPEPPPHAAKTRARHRLRTDGAPPLTAPS
jgi:hypothetical protein